MADRGGDGDDGLVGSLVRAGSRPEVVLVTGASAGIGLALARLLVQQPHYVTVLTARESSMSRFEQLGIEASDRVLLRKLDVTSADERVALIEELEEKFGGVDVLVNNAGVAYRSVVEHVTEDDRLAQMNVNFRAPMALTRLVLPSMRSKRSGRVISLSSVGGMMAMPTMAVYSASKFALEGATEALWYEVRPWGIKVSLIEPGFINDSGMASVRFTAASRDALAEPDAPYHAHYRFMEGFIAKTASRAVATPERVAKKILRVMRQKNPPLRVAATIDATFFSAMRRFLPRRFYHWILYRSLPSIRTWGQNSGGGGPDGDRS